MFEIENVKLTFSDESLRTISKKAIERKTGARGLRSILESRTHSNSFKSLCLALPSEKLLNDRLDRYRVKEIYIHLNSYSQTFKLFNFQTFKFSSCLTFKAFRD